MEQKKDTFFANDFVDQNTTFFFSSSIPSSLVMAINLAMTCNITTSPLAVWTLLQCLILIGGQKNNAIFVIHPFYSKRLNRFVSSLWLVESRRTGWCMHWEQGKSNSNCILWIFSKIFSALHFQELQASDQHKVCRHGMWPAWHQDHCMHWWGSNWWRTFIHSLLGLPKDQWELAQMLGRGGRDGNNAVFVIMLWTGQAG